MSPLFATKVLTLNFEGSSIRLLSARGENIEQWHTLELPKELMSGGTVHQPDQAAAELRSVIDQLGIRPKKVICSVSGQHSIYRILRLPKMKDEYLDGAVRRKIRQEIALQPEETDIFWQIVGRSNGELSVYVVALPRDLIDRQIRTTLKAGLKTDVLDVKPLALLHAVNTAEGVIANLESHGVTIVVVRDGVPGIIRMVPLPDDSQNQEGRLDLLAHELQRTIKFFNESNKERPLTPGSSIYATGQDFDRQHVMESLSTQLDYPLKLGRPPINLPAGMPIATYAANVGLMLKRK